MFDGEKNNKGFRRKNNITNLPIIKQVDLLLVNV